ncbi:unnamed protein product [Victoria cruziana]
MKDFPMVFSEWISYWISRGVHSSFYNRFKVDIILPAGVCSKDKVSERRDQQPISIDHHSHARTTLRSVEE